MKRKKNKSASAALESQSVLGSFRYIGGGIGKDRKAGEGGGVSFFLEISRRGREGNE